VTACLGRDILCAVLLKIELAEALADTFASSKDGSNLHHSSLCNCVLAKHKYAKQPPKPCPTSYCTVCSSLSQVPNNTKAFLVAVSRPFCFYLLAGYYSTGGDGTDLLAGKSAILYVYFLFVSGWAELFAGSRPFCFIFYLGSTGEDGTDLLAEKSVILYLTVYR
jgi:hypothetical protein